MHLHIISFDVPYPADYGGVIDVFYKLKYLHRAGVKVHLHCFQYGRVEAPELLNYCQSVNYYPRRSKSLLKQFSLTPFTVLTRQSKALEAELLKDDYPILCEVLHTCYLLKDARFKKRIKLFRHSNIEHVYYRQLAESEKSIIKRWYLKLEAYKLERFEPIVEHASAILAVNEKDAAYFKKKYQRVRTYFLPSFHPNEQVGSKVGIGQTVLYHGNLSISENYESALWLIKHVFSQLPNMNFIIAGKNPPDFLEATASAHKHIELIKNPSETELGELVQDAHLHCLHTHQGTGLKLKLLNVLFQGRFVICNSQMLNGTSFSGNGADSGVFTCDTAEAYISTIKELSQFSFSKEHVLARQGFVANYENVGITARLLGLLSTKRD